MAVLSINVVRFLCAALVIISLLLGSRFLVAETPEPRPIFNFTPVLDDRCTINILNGSTRVEADGSFALLTPLALDVPYRARAVCEQEGHLLYGESALIFGVPNGESQVGEIFFDRNNPIPVTLTIVTPATMLDANTPVIELQVLGRLPDGRDANLTPGETGMVYSASSDVVSVSADGVVSANRSGRAIVSARYEGVMASVEFQVFFPLDSDGDGLPDDYEIRNGLDPHNAADALADADGDGLTNLEEYLLGTSPIHADTDGDTLSDAEELAYGTDPLLPDSDADGLIDGEEILRGTNALSADSDNDGLSDSVEIQFGLDPLTFTPTTSIAGRVVDNVGSAVVAASVVVFNTFSAVTNSSGAFLIERVPVVAGSVTVSARIIRGGQILDGQSQSLQLQTAMVAQAGDIVLQPVLGELFGTVKNPRGEVVPGARITITAQEGSDQRFINADYQGMFQVQGLPQGLINVLAQDPRTGLYGTASGTLTSNANLQLDIDLRALGTVQGKVLLADGATAAGEGRAVTLTRIGGGYSTTLMTNAFGEYQATFVPLGEYIVEAYGNAKQRARTTVVLSGTTQVNDANLIFLGTGTVSGYVETSNGMRVANLPVKFSSSGLFPENLTATTNTAGEFVFNQVFVGDFHISATDKLNKLTGSVKGGLDLDGQHSDVAITLSMTSTLEGIVRFANGAVAAAVDVSYQDQKVTTNSSGFYRFEHVPLGTLVVTAQASNGERAQFNISNETPNQVVQHDIQLMGVGTLEITVTNSKGSLVPGVQLTLTQSNLGNKNAITGSNGKAVFNNVLATQFNVTAFDPIDRLGARLASTMIAGEQVAATMVLESAGDILGMIYRADGITPAANIAVQLQGWNKSVITGSDGRYQFNMLPISGSPYKIIAKDAQGVVRAQSAEARLQIDGEQALVNLILIGDGAVQGRVFNPDSQVAKGITVTLRSHISGAKALTSVTDVNGEYRFPRVPVGAFSIEAVNQANRFAGNRELTLEHHEQELMADIVMEENRLPSQANTVASLQDGNGFAYPVLRNGAIADGTRSVFAGDGNVYRGAGRLDITANDEILVFENASASLEQQGQQARLEKRFANGLQVMRKTYVSPIGYFARSIEQFTNTSTETMRVSARLDSHYRISTYDRTVNGSTRRVSVPVGIVSTSSGDTFLNISSGVADRWVLLDDDMDVDPFNEANMPAIVHLLDGRNAAASLANGEFLSGTSGAFNRLRVNWDLTIEPGQSVALMHFTVQQTDRIAALDTINRLDQLPPEALVGISAQERQAIVNFNVPEVSSVAELPYVFGNINGHIYEHDGATAVANAWVNYKSAAPLFKRTWRLRTDRNGSFSFVGRTPNSSMGLVPINGFNLAVQHPHSGTVAQADFGLAQFSNNSATADVSFNNTSIIRGTVRRYDGVVASYGYVELMGGTLNAAVKTSIAEDGEYQFSGVLPGSYQLIATLPDPHGTAFGGSIDVQLPANLMLVRDIALAQVSGVSGYVFNGAGHAEAGVVVKISASGFSRNTRTDSGGFYEFLDMPLGDFWVSVDDPGVSHKHQHAVSVAADQMVQQNIQLIPIGQLHVLANYDDDSIATNAMVQLKIGNDNSWRSVGRISALGRLQINNIPVGNWSIRILNINNTNLFAEQSGVIQTHGEQQQITLAIPKDYPPQITLISPAANSNIMVGERINLSVQVQDDYGLSRVEYYIGERWLTSAYQSPYNASVLLEVAAGINHIRAVATDIAGNKAEHSVPINMVQDNQAPEVRWVTPQANSQFIEGQSFSYQFSATDNIGVRDVGLYLNGELIRTVNSTSDYGTVNIPTDYATTASTMRLQLKARDYAGNQGTAELTVQILNDELPTVSLLSGPAEGSLHLEGATVGVTFAAKDDIGVTRVDLVVNNEVVQSRFNAPYQFSLEVPLLESITNPLTIRARAYDTLQQQQNSQLLNLIVQKNMPPQIQWLQPNDLAQFYEGELISIRANASDDVALSHVDFYVDGLLVATDSVAPFEASYRLPSGVHNTEVQLKATAVDSINQKTSVVQKIVRLDDVTAPSINISAPVANGIISLGESDVVIVIDTSGSADSSSGADVNGDGYNDSILAAEVYAAKQLLNFLNPVTTRVAIVDFESSATLMLGLTDNFEEANRILDRIFAMGATGGTDFSRAMNVATTELIGSRSRPGATPVQLFMSDGDASHPSAEIQRAVDAGIIVNTFAVGYGASTYVLQNIANGTGGVATVVPDASRIVEILPRTILFGLDALIAVTDASDNIAVKEVTISAQTLAGDVLDTRVDAQAPFSAALALPVVDQPLEVLVSATAVDYGNNQAQATPVKVTLLPAQTAPAITRLDPAYARNNDLIKIKGQFLAASNNTTPSVQNPGANMVTRAFVAGVEVPVISATKGEAQIRFPANLGSSEVLLEVDGVRTNALMLYLDSDLDGLSDEDELIHNTDPNNRDTDGDGLSDGAEVHQSQTNPLSTDSDADGLPDAVEIEFGLNPNNASDAALDLDSDGLTNLQEYRLGISIRYADSDGDGLKDGREVELGTNPLSWDSDGDGIRDGDEVNYYNTNPLSNDTDGDGLPDYYEINYGLNPRVSDAHSDTDGDGLTNAEEYALGTSPNSRDSDNDGLSDYDEVHIHNTRPTYWDTDGDGDNDGLEVSKGTDPNDARSSVTVGFYHSLFDGGNNEWIIHNSGAVNNSGLYSSRGMRLLVNGYEYNDADGRAERDSDNQIAVKPSNYSNASLTRKIYASTELPFIRYFETIKNTSSSDRTYNVQITDNYLHSSGAFNVVQTSSGDANVDSTDNFIIVDDNNLSGYHAVAHWWSDADAMLRPNTVQLSSRTVNVTYSVQIPAGGSVSLVHFAARHNDRNELMSTLQTMQTMPETLLAGLSLAEINSIANLALVDTDGDGLLDIIEQWLGTDSNNADTDGDGLSDSFEHQYGLNPLVADDANSDFDGDGLSQQEEMAFGTNPALADSDGDGLNDGDERQLGTNPLSTDSDNDGLSDGEEVHQWQTNPLAADSDGDGISDYEEVMWYGTNPNASDSDGDGLADGVELNAGLDPLDASDAAADFDGDGLSNAEEVQYDTDVWHGDSDGDGLSDLDEIRIGTDPRNDDTDGDGDGDYVEVTYGSDPLDPESFITVALPLWVEDGSGNEWRLNQNGYFDQVMAPEGYEQGLKLFVNRNGWYNDFWSIDRAVRIADNSYAFVESPYSEVASDVEVSRVVHISQQQGFLRYLETFTNTQGANVTIRFQLYSHVSSEAEPMSAQSVTTFSEVEGVLTSAGQNTLTAADKWLVSAQMPSGQYLGHLWANDNSNATLVSWYADAQEIALEFELTIPANSTVNFMHYMVQGAEQQQVAQQLTTLLQDQAVAFSELTDEQLLTIGNMLPDADGDGLSDVLELRLGTDPNNTDSDGDGLLDGFEYRYGFNSLVAGEQLQDPDSDGLTNLQEQQAGSHPHKADTDGDGLSDSDEVNVHGTSPVKADSDGDGLWDADELELGTSPTNADSDGDGLIDGDEFQWGTNPLQADSDGDGITDGLEVQLGLNPTDSGDALEDGDGDGLTNLQEVQLGTRIDRADTDRDGLTDADEVSLGTNPLVSDTDGDGLLDGYEVRYGLNPLQADDVTTDLDNDGLTLLQEHLKGTNPVLADTDGDGVDDLHDELPLNPDRTERLHVLLVDDSGDSQMGALLQSALDTAQLSYSTFNTHERDIGELTRQLMAEHQLVLWTSGTYGYLSDSEEYALSSYLNGGGCALYTAQDHHYSRGLTPILSEFFGVSDAQSDRISGSSIALRGAGSLFPEQSVFSLYYTVSNYSDTMSPTVDAESLFRWNDATVATYVNSGRHLGAFLGFPLEMISNNGQRALVIERMLEQCSYYHDLTVGFAGGEVDIPNNPQAAQ